MSAGADAEAIENIIAKVRERKDESFGGGDVELWREKIIVTDVTVGSHVRFLNGVRYLGLNEKVSKYTCRGPLLDASVNAMTRIVNSRGVFLVFTKESTF